MMIAATSLTATEHKLIPIISPPRSTAEHSTAVRAVSQRTAAAAAAATACFRRLRLPAGASGRRNDLGTVQGWHP